MLKERINAYINDILARVISQGAASFQLTANEVMVEHQFDFCLLSARGFQSIAKKYADTPEVGIMAAVCQDELLQIIGVDLGEYAQAKAKLDQSRDTALLEAKNEQETQRIKQIYYAKLGALRNQYNVQKLVDDTFHEIYHKEGNLEELRNRFSTGLSGDWYEPDIKDLQRLPHESDREFRIKQELNDRLKDYQALLRPVQDDIALIEQDIANKKQVILKEKNSQGISIESTLAEINQKYDALIQGAHANHDKFKNNSWSYLPSASDLDGMSDPQEIMAWVASKAKDAPAEDAQVYQYVQSLMMEYQQDLDKFLLDNHIQFGKRAENLHAIDSIVGFLQGVAPYYDSQQLRMYVSERQEELEQAMQPVQDRLNQLESSRVERIRDKKQEHKQTIQQADKYYNDEIAHRVKLLRCAEVNTLFSVTAQMLPQQIDEATLANLDANTIAFFAHMGHSSNHIKKLSSIINVASGIMLQELEAQGLTAEAAKDNKPFREAVARRVIEGLKTHERSMLDASGIDTHQLFEMVVNHMAANSQMQIPDRVLVADEDGVAPSAPTLLDFMPQDEIEPIPVNKKKDFFQEIEKFNEAKGIFSKTKAMYQFYQTMTAPNPEACFDDVDNPGLLFFKTLDDESNAAYLQCLPTMQRALEAFIADGNLDTEQAAYLQRILEQVIDLQERRQLLDASFEALLEVHQTARAAFSEKKAEYDEKGEQLANYDATIQSENKKIIALEQELNAAGAAAQRKYLPQHVQEALRAPLEQSEKRYMNQLAHLNQRTRVKEIQIDKEHDDQCVALQKAHHKKVQSMQKQHEDDSNDILMEAYLSKKGKTGIGRLYNRYLDKPSQADLEAFLNHPDNESTKSLLDSKKSDFEELKSEEEKKLEKQLEEVEKSRDLARHHLGDLVAEQSRGYLAQHQQAQAEAMIQHQAALKKIEAQIQAAQRPYLEKIQACEARVAAAKEGKVQIEAQREALRESMKDISREYYQQVEAFQKAKQSIIHDAKNNMSQFLSMDPQQNAHLSSCQGMFQVIHDKAKNLNFAASLQDPLLEEAQLRQMTFDQVVSRSQTQRDVRAIHATSDEKSRTERAVDNAVQMGSRSVVAAMLDSPMKQARLYAQQLGPTLKAENTMRQQQALLNEHEKTLGAEVKADDPVVEQILHTVHVEQNRYKKPWILRGINSITDSFHVMMCLLVKGTVLAAIENLKREILRSGSEDDINLKIETMYRHLDGITNIKQRAEALEKIEQAIEPQKLRVLPVHHERLEFESMKNNLVRQIQSDQTQDGSRIRNSFTPGRNKSRRDNAYIQTIVECTDIQTLGQALDALSTTKPHLKNKIDTFRSSDEYQNLTQKIDQKVQDRRIRV